jgi:hypothetical protein
MSWGQRSPTMAERHPMTRVRKAGRAPSVARTRWYLPVALAVTSGSYEARLATLMRRTRRTRRRRLR